GSRTGIEVIASHGAHEGQLHMGMRVDTAGHHILAARIYHFGSRGGIQILTYGNDLSVIAVHIGAIGLVSGDHGTVFYEYGHCWFSLRVLASRCLHYWPAR